jgi:preprotein translocase subunit SecA
MISRLLKKFSGRHYQKYQKKCAPQIERINALELEFQALSDAELRAKTAEYMERFQQGATLDELLPEAFATVKSAARRMCGNSYEVCDHELPWNMVHYDVQLLGGIAFAREAYCGNGDRRGEDAGINLPAVLECPLRAQHAVGDRE